MLYLVFIAALLVLEFFFPIKKINIKGKEFLIDSIWYLSIQTFLLQVFVFEIIDRYLQRGWMHTISGFSTVAQVIIMFLVIDFIDYWMHRLSHSWWLLWRQHEVHHTSIELNILSANRIHFTELITVRIMIAIILAISGMSEQAMFWFATIDSLNGLFIHINVNVNYGPLHYLFIGPKMHRVHHLNQKQYQLSNFGTRFAIWDWLFGTAYLPQKDEFKDISYGIGYEYPQNLPGQIFYAFRKEKKVDNKKDLQQSLIISENSN